MVAPTVRLKKGAKYKGVIDSRESISHQTASPVRGLGPRTGDDVSIKYNTLQHGFQGTIVPWRGSGARSPGVSPCTMPYTLNTYLSRRSIASLTSSVGRARFMRMVLGHLKPRPSCQITPTL